MKNFLFISAIGTELLMSCGGGSNQSNENNLDTVGQNTGAKMEICSYSYNPKTTTLHWTAFKHTDRAAVKGMFDSVEVSGTQTASSPAMAAKNVSFRIFTAGINSNDLVRDAKIKAHYFGNIANTTIITGMINSLEGSDEAGNCDLTLKLNDIEKEVAGSYLVEGDTLQIKCTLDMNEWGCQKAIAALQKACDEKHTGADGKTVFWPDVEILVKTTLTKTCK